MRFLFVTLMALLLAASPAFAEEEPFAPFDHAILYTVNGKYVVYECPDITLFIPINWDSAATVLQDDDGIGFYHTGSYEKWAEAGVERGGFLCKLCASEDEAFRDLPAYEYLGFSESAGLHFYLVVPSDDPAYADDAAVRAEYDEMHAQVDEIVEMARISRSMRYYTDDVVTTDAGMS